MELMRLFVWVVLFVILFGLLLIPSFLLSFRITDFTGIDRKLDFSNARLPVEIVYITFIINILISFFLTKVITNLFMGSATNINTQTGGATIRKRKA